MLSLRVRHRFSFRRRFQQIADRRGHLAGLTLALMYAVWAASSAPGL
jgi:hypothetical protein